MKPVFACLTLCSFYPLAVVISGEMSNRPWLGWCCSQHLPWPCNLPGEEKPITIEAYQPPVPKDKQFLYPQHKHGSSAGKIPVGHVVTSQPLRSKQTHSQSGTCSDEHLVTRQSSEEIKSVTSSSVPLLTLETTTATHKDATLEFNIYYDTFRESLSVHIHRGLYFPPNGSNGVNSFIKAMLLPLKKQVFNTKVVSNSQSPAYDQMLEFSGLSLQELEEQSLVLQVYYCESEVNVSLMFNCITELRDINLMRNNELTKKLGTGPAK